MLALEPHIFKSMSAHCTHIVRKSIIVAISDVIITYRVQYQSKLASGTQNDTEGKHNKLCITSICTCTNHLWLICY